MKQTYNTADLLDKRSNRVVFNIAGKNYRMICKYILGLKQAHLFVCWLGTHSEYDKICKKSYQYIIKSLLNMEATPIKYTIIRNKMQYDQFCSKLETLLIQGNNEALQDEIDLLRLLIEKYDEEHNSLKETDPITLLRSFMHDHHLKPQEMTRIIGISKGYISDILIYKKGLSKEVIRKLADYFKVRQEAFNRPYKLSITS